MVILAFLSGKTNEKENRDLIIALKKKHQLRAVTIDIIYFSIGPVLDGVNIGPILRKRLRVSNP